MYIESTFTYFFQLVVNVFKICFEFASWTRNFVLTVVSAGSLVPRRFLNAARCPPGSWLHSASASLKLWSAGCTLKHLPR